MATNRVILYRTPVVIGLVRVGHGIRNDNPPMNRSNFALYQGADAAIEFVVRDTDRKPINLLGKTLTLTVMEPLTGALVLTKRIRVLDPHKGSCRVRFSPGDLLTVWPQFYTYSILMNNHDGTSELLMTDQNATARGVLEIRAGVLPEPARSVEITGQPWDRLVPVRVGDPPIQQYRTGALPADGPASDPNGLHTVAIYPDNYRGRLWVQASLLDQPTTADEHWFDVDLGTGAPLEFTPDSGLEAYNFSGHYRWVRFVLQPSLINKGGIAKILLRN
jgi:hypothetical protein